MKMGMAIGETDARHKLKENVKCFEYFKDEIHGSKKKIFVSAVNNYFSQLETWRSGCLRKLLFILTCHYRKINNVTSFVSFFATRKFIVNFLNGSKIARNWDERERKYVWARELGHGWYANAKACLDRLSQISPLGMLRELGICRLWISFTFQFRCLCNFFSNFQWRREGRQSANLIWAINECSNSISS